MNNKIFGIIIGVAVIVPLGYLFVRGDDRPAGTLSNSHGATQVQRQEPHQDMPSIGAVAQAADAPDFELKTPDGEVITLSQFKGEKPVILDFWASWCHNCQRAMPRLSKLYEQYNDDIEIIGINLQENKSVAQRFVDSRNIAFPIVMDPFASASRAYGVQYTNTHALIDKNGKLVQIIPGDLTEEHLISLINTGEKEG